MGSVRPVQHVAHDRPARLTLNGLLTENSVAIKRDDGTVAPLELHPCIEKRCRFVIATDHRIGQHYLDDPVPAQPRVLWIKQRPAPSRARRAKLPASHDFSPRSSSQVLWACCSRLSVAPAPLIECSLPSRHQSDDDRSPGSENNVADCVRHRIAQSGQLALRLVLDRAQRSRHRPGPGAGTQ